MPWHCQNESLCPHCSWFRCRPSLLERQLPVHSSKSGPLRPQPSISLPFHLARTSSPIAFGLFEEPALRLVSSDEPKQIPPQAALYNSMAQCIHLAKP